MNEEREKRQKWDQVDWVKVRDKMLREWNGRNRDEIESFFFFWREGYSILTIIGYLMLNSVLVETCSLYVSVNVRKRMRVKEAEGKTFNPDLMFDIQKIREEEKEKESYGNSNSLMRGEKKRM